MKAHFFTNFPFQTDPYKSHVKQNRYRIKIFIIHCVCGMCYCVMWRLVFIMSLYYPTDGHIDIWATWVFVESPRNVVDTCQICDPWQTFSINEDVWNLILWTTPRVRQTWRWC